MRLLDRAQSPDGRIVLLSFHCPGCQERHGYYVENPGSLAWQWNGSMERPTFTPSLLCRRGEPRQCHLFVTDGQIQFCGDCHHGLAGQTVPMVDLDSPGAQ